MRRGSESKAAGMNVSVVIPAYNAEQTVRRTIDSVLGQTSPAHEIIVVDDGSTDDTIGVLRSYGDRIIAIEQQNAGASVARNNGIAASTGEWIAFLDADDEWLPDKLQRQTEHLARMPELRWTFSNFYVKTDASQALEQKHERHNISKAVRRPEVVESYFRALLGGITAWTGSIIVHRSVFDTVGMFEPGIKRAQDNDLWFRIAYRYPTAGYLSEPSAIYHKDTPGSSVKVNTDVESFMNLVHRHENLSRAFNKERDVRPALSRWIQYRMRLLLQQKQYDGVKTLLHAFEGYLPFRFKQEVRFTLLYPPVCSPIAEALRRVKQRVRHRFRG